jgi:hypothetical protein
MGNRIGSVALHATLVLVGAAVLDHLRSASAEDKGTVEVLRVRELHVLGEDGTVVLKLGSTPEGGMAVVSDPHGKPHVTLSAGKPGGRMVVQTSKEGRCAYLGTAEGSPVGLLQLTVEDGQRVVEAGLGTDGGYVTTANRQGKTACFLGGVQGGGGSLQVNDAEGSIAADIAAEGKGPQMRLHNPEGAMLASLGVSPESRMALLTISGHDEKPAATVGQVEGGGVVTVSGRGGHVTGTLAADLHGGRLTLHRPDGKVSAQAATGVDGGQVFIANKEGGRVVELSGSAEGGQVDVRRREGKDALKLAILSNGPAVVLFDTAGKKKTLNQGTPAK